MNWYLLKSSFNAQPVQGMFYTDGATAMTFWGMMGQASGSATLLVWGSGTWQPTGMGVSGLQKEWGL